MTWTDQALCAQVGGDAWYPEHDSSPDASKRVCQRCPVKVECLEWAIATGEEHGVWGGLTPQERRRHAAA